MGANLVSLLESSVGGGGGSVFVFKGTISVPADFPLGSEVQNGWTYEVLATVIDNDPTRTNTNQTFTVPPVVVIAWNGTDWTDITGTEYWKYLAPFLSPLIANSQLLFAFASSSNEHVHQVNLNVGTSTGSPFAYAIELTHTVARVDVGNVSGAVGVFLKGHAGDTADNSTVGYYVSSDGVGASRKIGFWADGNLDYAVIAASGKWVRSTSSLQTIVLASGIPDTKTYGVLVEGPGVGDNLITANPQIIGGVEGEERRFFGTSDTKKVTMVHGNGVKLDNGVNFALGLDDNITLEFRNGSWVQVARVSITV